MEFNPTLNLEINGKKFTYRLFEALNEISQTYSQREAAKRLGISHSVLNRRILDSEERLGFKLVHTTGAGSGLTPQGISILEKYHEYLKRLRERDRLVLCGGPISTGLMDVLANNYGLDAAIMSSDDVSALEMADMGLVDLVLLDDPVHAFIHDLDFIPVARDHLVLISSSAEPMESPEELNGKKFIEIPHSAQRLAWNTLDQLRIDYRLVEVCNSPQTALKMVYAQDDLHTFLNNSFTSSIVSGSDLFAADTMHLITMVPFTQKPQLEDFAEFVQGRGQEIVLEWGFKRID
ncbi:MAG: LysR family transcriptional regulator [Methanobacteriaceae archaeon]|nr:LysR family transcriptional regulator [Methanobacteriaceae archaeon]